MNYIELLNQFWQTRRKVRLSSNEADLFYFLLNESNSRMWENPFECPNILICATIGMTEKTLIDVRNRLVQKGFISVEAGQRKKKSPVYTLLYCNKVSKNVSIEGSITDSITVSKNPNIIINKTNTKQDIEDLEEKPDRFPNKNEVIDFFMAQKELKPSEAESQAESFYAHFSEIGEKSASFDWREEAKIWQSKISGFKGEKNQNMSKCSSKGEKSQKSKVNGKITRFKPPTIEEVDAYCKSRNNGIDAEHFVAHYEANGWMRGKTKIKDWRACIRTWELNNGNNKNSNNEQQSGITESLARSVAEGIARGNYQE